MRLAIFAALPWYRPSRLIEVKLVFPAHPGNFFAPLTKEQRKPEDRSEYAAHAFRGAPEGGNLVTIAKHGHKTPAEARTLAKVKLGDVAEGKDVAQIEKEKRSKFAVGTLKELVERYLGVKARDTRYWRETRRLLEQNLLDHLDSKAVATVTKTDIANAINKAAERSHAAARNVFAAVRPLFAWAHDQGIIENNPIAGMKGPAPLKSRDRVLSDAESVL